MLNFKAIWANIRCDWYLLWNGMWKGECKFVAWHKKTNQVAYVAATTGSIWDGTIQVQRVFLNEAQEVDEKLHNKPTEGNK